MAGFRKHGSALPTEEADVEGVLGGAGVAGSQLDVNPVGEEGTERTQLGEKLDRQIVPVLKSSEQRA